MTSRIVFSLFALCLTAGQVHAQERLQVQPDRQNVVASRLAGAWQTDSALTERLRGSPGVNDANVEQGGARQIEFRSDPSIVEQVPQAMVDIIRSRIPTLQIFMAGTVSLSGVDHPFILLNMSGNMTVVWFRERNGDPMGDAESFFVQLAPASEPQRDILLVGGDFNNQPFSALSRVGAAGLDPGTGN